MNNFELERLTDEIVRREFSHIMADVFYGMLGVDEAINQYNDAIYDAIDKMLDPIGGHGPASPYNEPLMAETNLFSPAKIRAGNACTAG